MEEAQRWHAAARNGAATRWLVVFRNDHGLHGADLPAGPLGVEGVEGLDHRAAGGVCARVASRVSRAKSRARFRW